MNTENASQPDSRGSSLGLRGRLLILVALAMLPILGLTIYTVVETRQHAAQEVKRNALHLARLAAGNQKLHFGAARSLLEAIGQYPEVRAGDCAASKEIFSRLLKQYPFYSNIALLDVKGDVVCSTVPMGEGPNYRDSPFFLRVMADKEFTFGDYIVSKVTKNAVLIFASPVLDPSGEVKRVAVATLNLGWINQYVQLPFLPSGSTLTVVDGKGVILLRRPGAGKWIGEALPLGHVTRIMARSESEGTAEGIGLDGRSMLYAFTALNPGGKSFGAMAFIGIPTDVAFADVAETTSRYAVMLAVVFVLAFAAAWFGGGLPIVRRVGALADASRRLAQGELDARTGLSHSDGELGVLARAFDDMAEALSTRIQDQKRIEEQLRTHGEQLQSLAAQLAVSEDWERRRIAVELHDSVGQLLSLLQIKLEQVKETVETGPAGNKEEVAGELDYCVQLLVQAVGETRTLVSELSPPVLYELGFEKAVEWLTEQFQDRHGLRVEFRADGSDKPLDDDHRGFLFRAVRELLVNVVKHGRAEHVIVSLCRMGDVVEVVVKDDGSGFDTEALRDVVARNKSFGLFNIRERLNYWGGGLNIRSTPGQGTEVVLILPLPSNKVEND
jgi:signal transduction histidine kinase